MKNWKREILSIPNLLSLFRLLLIPVYITIYLKATNTTDYLLAGAILAVSCLTDMIDGKIARKFNMITTFGKILDPLADKATQLALILCLAVSYPVLRVLVCLFVIKEGFMLAAGCINLKKGKMLKGALMSGKVCTTVLFISLIALVVLPNLNDLTRNIITIVDAVFMVIALTDYAIAYFKRDAAFQDVEIFHKDK